MTGGGWIEPLDVGAPDVVACWRPRLDLSGGLKALRRELRARVHEGDTPRILAQQEVVGDGLERVLRDARAPAGRTGGEEDWNVAQAFAHTTAARRFLGTWAALDAGGEWPKERAAARDALGPGRADATREEPSSSSTSRDARSARPRPNDRRARAPTLRDGSPADRAPALRRMAALPGIHDCMHLEQLHRLLETDAAAAGTDA